MHRTRVDARAECRVPGDKSITHRALMFAALARGTSRLRGLLASEDPCSTAAAMRALGCNVPDPPRDGGAIEVHGGGLAALRAPDGLLDCGNSGTTARLLLGVLSGFPLEATLTGDASLRSRPMRRVTEPLSRMGARFEELERPDRLPLRVRGGDLRSVRYDSPHASAQVKSAVLLAGLTGRVGAEVTEPVLSRDHTERMLRAMGVPVESGAGEGGAWAALRPVEQLDPLDLDVPGDFSSAAFLIALAALAPAGPLRIRGVGTNPGRTGLLPVLERMGVALELESPGERAGEPVADLIVHPSVLRAVEVAGHEVPAMVDELPILAVMAARAEGETRITGASELRVKETDRIAALVRNLRAIGVAAEELEDGLVVVGTDAPLEGDVASYGDHRIAMAFGVLGALPGARIRVDTPQVTDVSYPDFWTELDRIATELVRT